MELVAEYVKDVSVLRRLLFAATFLPEEYPAYWETVCKFAMIDSSSPLDVHTARLLMENLKVLNKAAFAQDPELTDQIISLPNCKGKPTGIVLMPSQGTCKRCGTKLLLRSDRPSRLTLYTERMGTVPALHYHKYCPNQKSACKLVQHYGYVTVGDQNGIIYDTEWHTLPFFVSSQETAIEISMLKKYNAELLIGQVSYKQKADIYNYHNGYDNTRKQSTLVSNRIGIIARY